MENTGFLQTSIPPRWSEMNPENATNQIRSALKVAQENIEKIRELNEPLSYENTVRALDRATDCLDRAWTYLNHLQSVADTPVLRDALNALMAEITDFYSSIDLDEKLFSVIKKFADSDEGKSLKGDKARLLSETLLDFEMSGANLPQEKKNRVRQIDSELAIKTQKYSENVLDDTKRFTLHIENESDLAGLPQTAVAIAKKKAQEKGLSGWAFTLEQPSYVPFMTYADSDVLREKLWREFSSVASKGEFSNWQLIREILELRDENSKLLSRANFADMILARRMARCGKTAMDFVDSLTEKFEKPFAKEWEELLAFARQNGYLGADEKMPPWRIAYVAEKLRSSQYGFDPELMRPYFPLESVMEGMFKICNTLYGLEICEYPLENDAWHSSVKLYQVRQAEKTLGLFYTDFFPRQQKRAGAWMNLLSQRDGDIPALGLIASNVAEPTDDKPALLSIDEVETLFHEFGHLIHFFMMDSEEIGLREVAWDFVELPSQIMENWCHFKNCLDIFAKHWQTGEKLPDELFAKYDASRKFMGASASMRQLSFAKIDLSMHINPQFYLSANSIEEATRETLKVYSRDTSEQAPSILPRFTHLFGDPVGYASGYYSYKWAEVLDADAFTRFEKEGVLNAETGKDFADKILRVGNTINPDEAFRNFMGRDADVEALVNRSVDFSK